MKRLILLVILGLLTVSSSFVYAAEPQHYMMLGSVNLAPSGSKLTAVDPLVYAPPSEVIPPRPFLYTVDKNGITITRFNDNHIVGTFAWPSEIYVIHPDGSWTLESAPAGGWEPVGMMVSAPTETEYGNRGMTGTTVLKPIPDLTPPPTFVYVVMKYSGLEWKSSGGLRAALATKTSADTESSMLIQLDVSDPSFSATVTPTARTEVGIVAAILGHGAGQPVYDRGTGNVYVGNMPSNSLTAGLTSFVSKIRRLNVEGAFPEAETGPPGAPVIRCGPQHPEGGIPVGRPQAYACYDPGGSHPIDDNEHVGAAGNYFWEFRNLPDWLKVAHDLTNGAVPGTGQNSDGILYGTPPTTGQWFAEARVSNLDEIPEGGIPSEWTPIQLLVTPTAEYLPVKVQFAAGVPSAFPLEGTSLCTLSGAPAWIDVATVPNGCVVMGKPPLDGEYYNFTMPGFTVAGYPTLSLVFSGDVFGAYDFVPLPNGVGLSGLGWHQVSKVADSSTETAVLSVEFIGVEPSTGQLYRILAPPGKPQPPNERPPETALTLDVVSTEGAPLNALSGNWVRFGEVAVEADRDIFVAATTNTADGALIKVSGSTRSVIPLTGLQPSFLDLDSDLRTAIPGVEPGQVDHNILWVTGTTGNAVVIDTLTGSVRQTVSVAPQGPLGSVSVDFGTQYAYVADESSEGVAIFGPIGGTRPQFPPRIWSAEEISWDRGDNASWQVMATGDGVPSLQLLGELPVGVTFTDNGNGTATIAGTPEETNPGADYAFVITATGSTGVYAQAFGIALQTLNNITSVSAATFTEGVAGSFTVTTDGWLVPVIWALDPAGGLPHLPTGVTFADTEEGVAILSGIPAVGSAGTYTFVIHANGGFKIDGTQTFTLTVNPATAQTAPVITSAATATMVIGGVDPPAPFLVTSTGSPMPVLSMTGALPTGVTFTNNGNSTATLAGTPLNTGSYPLTFTASSTAGSAAQAFTLIVESETSMLGATPATLSFITDGTFAPSQTVSLTTTGDVLPYAITSTANWLTATPVSGLINGTTGTLITVSANAAGLATGTYTGTIIVNSAGTEGPAATVAVTLMVVGVANPGMVGIWPGTLKFEYNVNQGTTPPPQMVWVMSGGTALNYTVSTNAKWLSAPASGTAPGGFSVSVDPKVGVGMHIGNLTIASAGALNGPVTIPVTLLKTAGDSDLIQVMFDVGGGPEGLAFNRNTHNLFITSSSAAAEAGSEAGSETGPEVNVLGPPEPSMVYHINPKEQKVVGEIVVHSEGEYIGANSKTGLAYHASQGTGEVAVIDGSTNTVLAFIPLTLDGGVYQPYQVAIDEAQNLIYVGAKAPAIPDPPSPGPGCKAIHEMPDDEYDCWNPGRVFVIDGETNQIVSSFLAGDDPEGVVFAAKNRKVYASNEDDGSITVAKGAVRNPDGSITPPEVLSTIIRGVPVKGWWQPKYDEQKGYYGERGQAALWPNKSACNGLDDEAEEADKMAVDPDGNVYIIDDRYRVAKINGLTDKVDKVLEIPGYDCELEVPDGSEVLFRNTANNIAYMALGKGRLYVTSEQNTLSLIDPATMTIKSTLTIPGAVELDAITTDPALNMVFITDEDLATLWILKGACANGTGNACVQKIK